MVSGGAQAHLPGLGIAAKIMEEFWGGDDVSKHNYLMVFTFFKIESYWTYEVCHGKHIRQYHEEKETGQVGFSQLVPTPFSSGVLVPHSSGRREFLYA